MRLIAVVKTISVKKFEDFSKTHWRQNYVILDQTQSLVRFGFFAKLGSFNEDEVEIATGSEKELIFKELAISKN